jgi:hypothetical protein
MERFAHGVNVPFGEERENVGLKAAQFSHSASPLEGGVDWLSIKAHLDIKIHEPYFF